MSLLQIGREQDVLAHQRAMNASRFIPQVDELVAEVSAANRVYIFNTGPWTHCRELGSAGRWFIPACSEGEDYSKPVMIEGLVGEPYPINEVECAIKPLSGKHGQLGGTSSGWDFAMQILGEGPHIPRGQSFRPFGVFLSHSEVPKPEELRAAKALLQQKYVELVRYASEAYAQGPVKAAEIIQPDWHFRAARALKKTEAECPWLANTTVGGERRECPNCGTAYTVGIAQCASCKNILDEAKYLENEQRMRDIKAKLKRGPGRPPANDEE